MRRRRLSILAMRFKGLTGGLDAEFGIFGLFGMGWII